MKEVQDHGRASGDSMDFDSGTEGKPVPFRLLHVCEFTGHRISREQVWTDVNALRRAVGDDAPTAR